MVLCHTGGTAAGREIWRVLGGRMLRVGVVESWCAVYTERVWMATDGRGAGVESLWLLGSDDPHFWMEHGAGGSPGWRMVMSSSPAGGPGRGERGGAVVGSREGRRYRGGALAATADQRLVLHGKGGLT